MTENNFLNLKKSSTFPRFIKRLLKYHFPLILFFFIEEAFIYLCYQKLANGNKKKSFHLLLLSEIYYDNNDGSNE